MARSHFFRARVSPLSVSPRANLPLLIARKVMAARNPAREQSSPIPQAKALRQTRKICSLRLFARSPRFSADDHLHVSLNRALAGQHFESHRVARYFEVGTLHGRTNIRR